MPGASFLAPPPIMGGEEEEGLYDPLPSPALPFAILEFEEGAILSRASPQSAPIGQGYPPTLFTGLSEYICL